MAKQAALGHGSEAGTKLVNPLGLCEALEQVLPESMDRQSVLVADGGDFVVRASLEFAGSLCGVLTLMSLSS